MKNLKKMIYPVGVIDVESVGLQGPAFAVAFGVYNSSGKCMEEFCYYTDPEPLGGSPEDLAWVKKNVSFFPCADKCSDQKEMFCAFVETFLRIRSRIDFSLWAECQYPVETNFFAQASTFLPEREANSLAYPIHEIATAMLASGLDPLQPNLRFENETPSHNPMADVRQSARLLHESLQVIINGQEKK